MQVLSAADSCICRGVDLVPSRRGDVECSACGAQVTVVLDMQGLDMSFADRRLLHFSKVLGGIEKDNYPELLKSLGARACAVRRFLGRLSWFARLGSSQPSSRCWAALHQRFLVLRMVRPFLDAGTEKKILVPSELSVLRQHVPSEALPEA